MELNEIRDKVLQHDISINNFDNWANNAEKRLIELEKSRDLMSDIKVALTELKMSQKYLTEKFDELKESIECTNADNKEQHKAICDRLCTLESKPGKSWDKLIWLVVAAVVGGVVGFLVNNLLK